MGEVIKFPRHNKRLKKHIIKTDEDAELSIKASQLYHSELLSNELLQIIITQIQRSGIPEYKFVETNQKKLNVMLGLLHETIKSTILCIYDINHPMHAYAERNVTIEDDEPSLKQKNKKTKKGENDKL